MNDLDKTFWLPNESNLGQLEILDLGANHLTGLDPQTLTKFPSLKHLLIERNMIESLPNELPETLQSLEVLWASHNRIKEIPHFLTAMKVL
ncbi:uncharacterized protein MONOS_17580 [Monocercomonoides exilis]|uniref:uncharacterized protein n=1 Tax=Monocercomonoides exilis TaxID=2049356 RepID=UPI00355A47DF|nr:hypothetical protein MONOS_17580 [Monocercomonoides exilis]